MTQADPSAHAPASAEVEPARDVRVSVAAAVEHEQELVRVELPVAARVARFSPDRDPAVLAAAVAAELLGAAAVAALRHVHPALAAGAPVLPHVQPALRQVPDALFVAAFAVPAPRLVDHVALARVTFARPAVAAEPEPALATFAAVRHP